METSELRIGNIIKDDDVTYVVSGIEKRKHQEVVYLDGNIFAPIALSNLNPVPITEEWLLKFGFEKGNNKMILISGDLGIVFDDYKGCLLTGKHVPIKHVHQLQNLYFALTGEELTLTDTK